MHTFMPDIEAHTRVYSRYEIKNVKKCIVFLESSLVCLFLFSSGRSLIIFARSLVLSFIKNCIKIFNALKIKRIFKILAHGQLSIDRKLRKNQIWVYQINLGTIGNLRIETSKKLFYWNFKLLANSTI